MCTYLKNIGGYKYNQLKHTSFEEIRKLFDIEMKRVNTFVPMDLEVVKGSKKKVESSGKKSASKKRAGEKLNDECVKKQKIKDDAEKEELRACLDIIPGDDVAINVESLATKYAIIDCKTHILTENMMYYQIIRANGSPKNYKIFSKMLDDFDRHEVLDLYRLVMERFKTTSPEGYDKLLWGDLITLFEPIHVLLMDNGVAIHMMVEKKYPLTQEMFSRMLSRRFEVDHESEMAFELLRFTRSQLHKSHPQVGNQQRRGYIGSLDTYCANTSVECTKKDTVMVKYDSAMVKYGNCKRVGHMTRDCKAAVAATTQRAPIGNQTGNTCYECGRQGHYRNEYPKLRNQNRRNKTGNKTRNNEAKVRAYTIGGVGANTDSNIVIGLLGHPFDIDLMHVELSSFDVINGDVCNGGSKSELSIISCTKTQKYIQKGCQVYLAKVMAKKNDDKPEEKRLKDVPIIRDFPEVFLEDFPGLPPTRQGEKEEDAFQLLKQKKCSAPILALPEGKENFVVYCDASHKGFGIILMQREKVIAYASCQLKVHEKNYTTHDLELVAAVFALKMWRHYMYGTNYVVFTDHKSLQHILDQKELNMRQR
ncbi:putative reverse transcriptase domain-containing protein [Tanacetum coccineum]|uniref:Reverse transcriptase domain-containing protein n=1 Tax=Tanacetum coccineum TaxID=301880 RepID=A0ABQ5D8J0_9ASTR